MGLRRAISRQRGQSKLNKIKLSSGSIPRPLMGIQTDELFNVDHKVMKVVFMHLSVSIHLKTCAVSF